MDRLNALEHFSVGNVRALQCSTKMQCISFKHMHVIFHTKRVKVKRDEQNNL